MIVGFPGETEQDFDTLCQFAEAAQFDRLGVFSYSDEDTSKSFELDQKVDAKTIYNRKRRLMSIQKKISRERNRALVGREFPVLVEGPSADSDLVWQARLSTQASRNRRSLLHIGPRRARTSIRRHAHHCASPRLMITI